MKSAITLGVFLFLSFLVGGVGARVTRAALDDWYPGLDKPSLVPPDTTFPVVWMILFITMSIAAWLIWREGWRGPLTVKRGLKLHFAQLLANMAWSVVFFGMQWPFGGMIVILLLWYLIVKMALVYRTISVPAFWLTVPYLIWVAFAAYLNITILLLN